MFATHVGIHEYDHNLPRGTRDAQLEELVRVKEALGRLEAIDRRGLSPSRRVDYGVLRNTLRFFAFETEELRIWESMPAAADLVGEALFPLFVREFAPLSRRMESITERLERTPRYVQETKGKLRTPVRMWVDIGLESAQRLPGFLEIIRAAGKEALPDGDRARLDEATAVAAEAFDAYGRWLESEVLPNARERTGIGAEKFRKLVRLRELGLTVDEIYAVGKRYLRDSKRSLARLAEEVKAGASVEQAHDIVKGDHPATFEEALAYTRKAMEEGKRFIRERSLATIPPNEELKVIETPSFLRHIIPFAAYVMPARFEPRQQGFYMVTPVEDKPEMLREHSYAGTRNTAVHEGYPGHHLQLTCANLNKSHARVFAHAVESIEGWAHYCEDMMKENGYSADPATRFVQMRDQVWRACRIIIDVDLHRGTMTFDGAVDFLVKEAGMERPGAVAEVKRYTYTPGYQLSYLVGKHLIHQLRKEVKRGLGKDYSDRLFHDTFLYAGSLPMKYMREVFRHNVKELRRLQKQGL